MIVLPTRDVPLSLWNSGGDGKVRGNDPYGTYAAGGAPVISAVQSINGGAGRRLLGGGFGSTLIVPEFLGGPDGHLENSSLGLDSDFGNWILLNSTPEAGKYIVDEATRGKCWYVDQPPGDYSGSIRYNHGSVVPENTRIYVSWLTKRNHNGGTGQWKKLRISYENDITDDGGEIVYFDWDNGSSQLIFRPATTSGDASTVGVYGNTVQTDGQWYRTEILLTTSTEGAKDGTCAFYLHDFISPRRLISFAYSLETPPLYPACMTYNSARRFLWFLWQNYRGNGNDDQEFWFDDPAVQVGGFSHAELGDNSDYASCTHLEYQKLTSRSDGQVDIDNLNLGSFGSASGCYLFFISDDGTASNGVAA